MGYGRIVWAVGLAIGVGVVGATLRAQQQAAPGEQAPSAPRRVPQGPNTAQLRPYLWLIGSWECDAEMPGRGVFKIKRECSWALDQQFIRIATTFDVEGVIVQEEAMLGYDQETHGLKLIGFGSDGAHSISSSVTPGADGSLVIDTRMIGGGAPGEHRIVFTPPKGDSFTTRIFERSGGDWAHVIDFVYRRAK